ncbi:MAG: ATP-binding protein [Candidatus Aenigmarchaeota archaeon]|nr:ATP-binding protein [Candidatus Aenigmarchaeota archaeon]
MRTPPLHLRPHHPRVICMPVEKIVVGRDKDDLKDFGAKGTAFIGKHIVGEGDDAHLTNPVHMDIARPHIVLVCGKRGTGKSYDAGILAEEIALQPPDVRNNLAVLLFDTMGIYWAMKHPNTRESALLKDWGLKPQAMPITLLVPKAHVQSYQDVGVEVDAPLALPAGELTAADWIITFGFSPIDEHGIAIERAVKLARETHGAVYGIPDLLYALQADKRTEPRVKDALANRFLAAMEWGIFDKQGTAIRDLLQPGAITVIDVSHSATGTQAWSVKGMLVGLLCRKLYQERLMARKAEEFEVMTGEKKQRIPLVWVMIDEAHEFLPSRGATAASEPLHTLIKQGREPGISVLLITQRPNKLHEDALSQADVVISHRLTSQADLQALRGIMQTYLLEDIQDYLNTLPRRKGTAIILDDNSERIFTAQIRPRLSWHAGGSPSALKKPSLFD